MKRSFVLAAVLALVFSAAAFGAVQDFGKFTLNVADGWTANLDGETAIIVKDDSSASMSVTMSATEGAALKDIAEAFVKELNGTNLATDESGNYTFEFTAGNGVKSYAVLNGDDKNYGLIVMTGVENASNEISAMVDSLTEK